jgi:SAM-dependent methyltransferase
MSSNHSLSSDHDTRTIQRYCDVCVVDGSAAGLAAALQLGRQRRAVIVVDAGPFGPAADRAPGSAADREEARRHGVEILTGLVTGVSRAGTGDFRAELSSGTSIVARRVLTAADLAGDGGQVGAMIGASLDSDDDARPRANEADWDHRYSGDRIWSGNPNGTLVNEVSDLTPGRALDVGAGEGGDAIWLAERGWTVTANDISQRALDRIGAEAERRGLRVERLRADANAADPFGTEVFDLVSAQYASIPRTADGRGVRNLLRAVAPGGTLLVVGHDLAPMRAPVDAPEHGRAFDPDAYVRTDDIAAALAASASRETSPSGETSPSWEIERHEKVPRPAGSASVSHHVDDIVLRARRLPQSGGSSRE